MYNSSGLDLELMRIVICYICKKQIESRSPFAHATLTNHLKKDHKETSRA